MHRKSMLATILAIGVTATAAWAATPAETISARQANFKQLGRSFKVINDQLKQSAPDVATIRTNAHLLDEAAERVHGFFPRGTGPETGVKTGALPVIWQKDREFSDRANQLVAAASGVERAANGGNLDAIKAAIPALGGACKACHETFKSKD